VTCDVTLARVTIHMRSRRRINFQLVTVYRPDYIAAGTLCFINISRNWLNPVYTTTTISSSTRHSKHCPSPDLKSCNSTKEYTSLLKIYLSTQALNGTLTSDTVFSVYCTAELIFVFFGCSILFFNHCILSLCICALYFIALFVILSLLLVVMGGQPNGALLSGSPPIVYI